MVKVEESPNQRGKYLKGACDAGISKEKTPPEPKRPTDTESEGLVGQALAATAEPKPASKKAGPLPPIVV